ncbi:hypothetical protein [Alicyclobacillus dauci]|uniref:Uncharacterized protein n=1 Tax=Alicyclobacillus dauci TaxID=1475485 RepID=A0ABY6Z6S9_9BACL|nr:hypothetical protein [Alicyclobacillus dauci]WAH38580.1 hypothetical protein NZD86_08910 [Alicyclobacillus dauci]
MHEKLLALMLQCRSVARSRPTGTDSGAQMFNSGWRLGHMCLAAELEQILLEEGAIPPRPMERPDQVKIPLAAG